MVNFVRIVVFLSLFAGGVNWLLHKHVIGPTGPAVHFTKVCDARSGPGNSFTLAGSTKPYLQDHWGWYTLREQSNWRQVRKGQQEFWVPKGCTTIPHS